MLRCHRCGGAAKAGLAHVHGDPSSPMCASCTRALIRSREAKAKVETLKVRIPECPVDLSQAA